MREATGQTEGLRVSVSTQRERLVCICTLEGVTCAPRKTHCVYPESLVCACIQSLMCVHAESHVCVHPESHVCVCLMWVLCAGTAEGSTSSVAVCVTGRVCVCVCVFRTPAQLCYWLNLHVGRWQTHLRWVPRHWVTQRMGRRGPGLELQEATATPNIHEHALATNRLFPFLLCWLNLFKTF